jgi:hypothetical protein
MSIQIAVFVVAVAVMAGGSYFYSRGQVSDVDEPDAEPDFPTILRATQAANPTLSFEPGRSRSPEFFWVKEHATGREAQVPIGELQGAKIRFVDCDLGSIAPSLLYPNRTDITCFDLRNDKHAMSAYFFRSKDDFEQLLTFFELNVAPEYRLGQWKGVRKDQLVTRTRRKESTHEFIVSYMLWSGGGFVGYREEKAAGATR